MRLIHTNLNQNKNHNLAPRWHEAKESGMGQIDPYQNENPPYIVLTHIAQDHAVNLHGRRLNIVCGTVNGKNEED